MKHILIEALTIVVLLAAFQSQSPPMTARWLSTSSARIDWVQPSNVQQTCLSRQPADKLPILITCLPNVPEGPNTLFLGNKGPLNASYKPQGGDTFILRFTNSDQNPEMSAPLRSVMFFPVFRR